MQVALRDWSAIEMVKRVGKVRKNRLNTPAAWRWQRQKNVVADRLGVLERIAWPRDGLEYWSCVRRGVPSFESATVDHFKRNNVDDNLETDYIAAGEGWFVQTSLLRGRN